MVSSSDQYWPLQPRFVPIPEVFHALEHDGPFRNCLRCGGDLLLAERYLIERVFKGTEPIVEYAMCNVCVESESQGLSPESLENVRQHFLHHLDVQSRVDQLRPLLQQGDVTAWLNNCLFTGQAAEDCRERQICGWCEGDQLRLDYSPFMLCGQAVEEIAGQLSEQTRGWMQDFVGENFGLPSEFCDNPDMLPLLI
ncbi:MAG: hypothetical protein VB858_21015 [Planctomycetaceae bacterium]